MIRVTCQAFEDQDALPSSGHVAVEIMVEDSGCGIPSDKLESIFREFEQVEATQAPKLQSTKGLGEYIDYFAAKRY